MRAEFLARNHVRDLNDRHYAGRECSAHSEVAVVQCRALGRVKFQAPRGFKVDIGRWLSMLNLIDPYNNVDPVKKSRPIKFPLCSFGDAVGGDGARQLPPVQRIEKFVSAWSQRDTLLHPGMERLVPCGIERRCVDLCSKLQTNQSGVLRLRDANEPLEECRLQLIAKATEHDRPDLQLKPFGVEQETVHIEDDTGEIYRHDTLPVGGRVGGAAQNTAAKVD